MANIISLQQSNISLQVTQQWYIWIQACFISPFWHGISDSACEFHWGVRSPYKMLFAFFAINVPFCGHEQYLWIRPVCNTGSNWKQKQKKPRMTHHHYQKTKTKTNSPQNPPKITFSCFLVIHSTWLWRDVAIFHLIRHICLHSFFASTWYLHQMFYLYIILLSSVVNSWLHFALFPHVFKETIKALEDFSNEL